MKYVTKLQSIAVAVALTLGFAANADVRINNDGFYELDVEPLDAFGNGEYWDKDAKNGDFPVGYQGNGNGYWNRIQARDLIDLCVVTKPIKLKRLLKKKERIIFTVGSPETSWFNSYKTNGFKVGNRPNDEKINSYALDLDPDSGGTFSVYKFHNKKTATRVASLDNLAANYTKKEIKSEDFYFRMVLGSDITWFEIWPVSDHNNAPRQRVNRTVLFTGFDIEKVLINMGKATDRKINLSINELGGYIGDLKITTFFDPYISEYKNEINPTIGASSSNIDKLVSCTLFKEKVTEHYVKPVNESYDPSYGGKPILPE